MAADDSMGECLVEVENQIQLAYISKVLVEELHEKVDRFQVRQLSRAVTVSSRSRSKTGYLVVCRVAADGKEEPRIASVD